MEIQDWGMKMALHIFRRQDDALSCLTSRCIYSIDSLESILWILWLLLFSPPFLQSVINFWERLPCIIVILYLWDSFRSLALADTKGFFFQCIMGTWNMRKTVPDSLCNVSTISWIKGKKWGGKSVHMQWKKKVGDRGRRKYFFKENSPIFSILQYLNKYMNKHTFKYTILIKVRDEKCLVLIFGYITGRILQ